LLTDAPSYKTLFSVHMPQSLFRFELDLREVELGMRFDCRVSPEF